VGTTIFYIYSEGIALNPRNLSICLAIGVLCAWGSAQAQWVTFQNQTGIRINAAPAVSTSDPEEKDYAWGDVDQDGDIDLVCVRKNPFSTAGGRPNVLFMNVNGVLTDQTALYASASDVPGDQGFLTSTNDRDVLLVDLNLDGWLDIVTATTVSDGLSKVIGHPRIYRNLGEVAGVWQGFRHEDFRIPQMLSVTGAVANPRFCSVAVGDVTGDGYPDIYFGDYDSGQTGPAENPNNDFDNKLLVNMGAGNPGVFVDESTSRMGSIFNYPGGVGNRNYLYATFGAASIICDINGDGVNDVVKQTALTPPQHVAVVMNNPANIGFFNNYKIVNSLAPYFVSAGDLNNDNRIDLVTTDDNADRYLLNTGNDANGAPNFNTFSFAFQAGGDDGFGSQSIIIDLDNDGWKDVFISDVDVDGFGCSRRAHIYRNLGNAPNVTLQEASPSVIPTGNLVGTYHSAIFDINGDGYNDIVLGRCNTMEVWINIPPVSINYTIIGGAPQAVAPATSQLLEVDVVPVNGALQPGTITLHYSINGGEFSSMPMTHVSGDRYTASLPAGECGDFIRYYIRGQLVGGGIFYSPSNAPAATYRATIATDEAVALESFEVSDAGWTVQNDASLTGGAWVRVDPVGTLSGANQAQPEDDYEVAPNVMCWVTGQGVPGGAVGAADVDGGPTHLISPPIDLTGSDAVIRYARWFFGSTGDSMTVAVSNNNGANWTTVETITTSASAWTLASFRVSDYFQNDALTANVRVRFSVVDTGTATTCEGAIDAFEVTSKVCEGGCSCPGNTNGDGQRNGLDIAGFVNCLLGNPGICSCADIDNNGLDMNDISLFVDEILNGQDCSI